MQPIRLDEIIATRTYEWLRGESAVEEVIINIGKPYPFDDGIDFICPYQIVTRERDKKLYAAGVDAVQALQLVMNSIGAELQYIERQFGGKLRIKDFGDDSALGFPTLPD